MDDRYRIVVSSENNKYLGWQSKLLHFSCVTRLEHQPLIVVHDTGGEMVSDFHDIVKAGGAIVRARSYRITKCGDNYPPRNTAGTLQVAADNCSGYEFIVLCDPDVIFVRQPSFPETLSGEFYPYMNYARPEVVAARNRLGIPSELSDNLRVGIPYVIPVAIAAELAQHWLEAIDALPPRDWTDVMYGFGLAAARMGLPVTQTNFLDWNSSSETLLTRDAIHYCYNNDDWSKRNYIDANAVDQVWKPMVRDLKSGTVLEEIVRQLDEARSFYADVF